jgi:hypothetical protein
MIAENPKFIYSVGRNWVTKELSIDKVEVTRVTPKMLFLAERISAFNHQKQVPRSEAHYTRLEAAEYHFKMQDDRVRILDRQRSAAMDQRAEATRLCLSFRES